MGCCRASSPYLKTIGGISFIFTTKGVFTTPFSLENYDQRTSFHQFALAELLPFFEQFPTQYLSGERNIKLAYRHLVQPESAVRKLMILVNGRAENMLKWTELAYDFYQQGYDVLLFDHRGQGYSQRIIPQKGHLDEFRFLYR